MIIIVFTGTCNSFVYFSAYNFETVKEKEKSECTLTCTMLSILGFYFCRVMRFGFQRVFDFINLKVFKA